MPAIMRRAGHPLGKGASGGTRAATQSAEDGADPAREVPWDDATCRPAHARRKYMNIKRNLVAVSALIVAAAIPAVSFASPAAPGGYLSVFLGTSIPQETGVSGGFR